MSYGQTTTCPDNRDCYIVTKRGKKGGSFEGWIIRVCTRHGIIVKMRKKGERYEKT